VVAALHIAADVTPHCMWRNGIELSIVCASPASQHLSSSSYRFRVALAFNADNNDCALSLDTCCIEQPACV
jgi:hypothetical protein